MLFVVFRLADVEETSTKVVALVLSEDMVVSFNWRRAAVVVIGDEFIA